MAPVSAETDSSPDFKLLTFLRSLHDDPTQGVSNPLFSYSDTLEPRPATSLPSRATTPLVSVRSLIDSALPLEDTGAGVVREDRIEALSLLTPLSSEATIYLERRLDEAHRVAERPGDLVRGLGPLIRNGAVSVTTAPLQYLLTRVEGNPESAFSGPLFHHPSLAADCLESPADVLATAEDPLARSNIHAFLCLRGGADRFRQWWPSYLASYPEEASKVFLRAPASHRQAITSEDFTSLLRHPSPAVRSTLVALLPDLPLFPNREESPGFRH